MALTVTNPFSPEETTADFLARREHELKSRIAALRGQTVPLEAELTQVQQMRAMLPVPNTNPLDDLAKIVASQTTVGGASVAALAGGQKPNAPATGAAVNASAAWPPNPFADPQPNPYAARTIKDLILQALIDGFLHGGTTGQLRTFMKSGYGRIVDPGSLRTALHRLKASGILGHDPSSDTWNFRDGQRPLFAPHESLQDEPLSAEEIENDEFLRRASELAWRDDEPTQADREAAERLEESRLHRVATSGEAASSTSNNEIIHDGGKLKLNP